MKNVFLRKYKNPRPFLVVKMPYNLKGRDEIIKSLRELKWNGIIIEDSRYKNTDFSVVSKNGISNLNNKINEGEGTEDDGNINRYKNSNHKHGYS